MNAAVNIRLPNKRELIQEKHSAPEAACKLNDHGHYLSKQGHIAAAVVALRRAVAMAPDHPVILTGLGGLLFDAGLYAEAEAALRKAVAIESEYAPGFGNLGSVLGAQGRYQEAHRAFRQALEIEPGFTDARWNFAMCLLDSGHWTEAWPYYEARKVRGGERFYPKYPYPEWRGEDLNGKTLHVQGEQGVGDRILFSRYLSWVKKEFPQARIRFQCEAEDLPNINNLIYAYRDFVEFIPNGVPWPQDSDYGIFLMSLPGLHGTTPDNVVPDDRVIARQAIRHKNSVSIKATDEKMLKVGITWTGSPGMIRNGERSIPLEQMLQLAEIPNVVLYSLQFGAPDIARLGAGQLVCDLTQQIRPMGFGGTAACIYNLDLIITCCTSLAHLAGALNAPCWTLLCANPYWLWLRDRADNVWYPNTQLFRQTRQNDWLPVIAEVKETLAECAEVHMRGIEQAA